MIDKTRELALKILYRIDKDGAYSNIVLNEVLKTNKDNIDNRDIGLISEIIYGTTTWKLTLDEIIKKYSNIKINKISIWILNILRMGIYQIVFLDKIPKSAAVNESVNLAKRYGHRSSSNFVNAILRKVEKKDYEELFQIENDIERISKTTSMPIWIVEKLLEEKSVKEVEEICINSNIRPNFSIRVNNLKTTKDDIKRQLDEKNIKNKNGVLKDFLVLENIKNLENLQLFKDGLFTVQDEAAALTAIVLNPKEDDFILDACSAPGGKTTYIAELMKNKGKIEAWDIYDSRINLIKENTKRLGIDIVETKKHDASLYNEIFVEKFDKILLDVPCLGIGVIKRKPDIKWKRKKEDINKIVDIQYKILETCSKYLKSKGVLVYSTCSILKNENQDIIEKFLENNSNFKISKYEIKEKHFKNLLYKDKYIQIYPDNNTDGFFICKLEKK